KSKILKKALKKNDPVTTAIMKRVAHTLGRACISLRHILNPQLIVFGGGIIEACGDFLLPRIRKTVNADPFFKKAGISDCVIKNAALGDDAVIIGAVALIKEKIK
ncbi:MAG: ROK family protein, partial [Candidatus Omnitrophica bacterium]|nr:ROK family protein [Candidatus Omnitrophota bacterium]